MLELFRKSEFPNRRHYSRCNDQTISMLLKRAIGDFIDKEDAKEFIDLLWNELKTGSLRPCDYAIAYDDYVRWYVDDMRTYFGTMLYLQEGYDT